jgi:integrase/recombinase XerD
MRRLSVNRDQASVLMMLDTGLRATELCCLTVNDVDLKTGKVAIRHGVIGGAKSGKGRKVYLGKVARKAVWRYLTLTGRGDEIDSRTPSSSATPAGNSTRIACAC